MVFYLNIYFTVIYSFTPVFSVTWSFRNHCNILIKKHFWLLSMLNSRIQLNGFFVNWWIFSGSFDEQNVLFEIVINFVSMFV